MLYYSFHHISLLACAGLKSNLLQAWVPHTHSKHQSGRTNTGKTHRQTCTSSWRFLWRNMWTKHQKYPIPSSNADNQLHMDSTLPCGPENTSPTSLSAWEHQMYSEGECATEKERNINSITTALGIISIPPYHSLFNTPLLLLINCQYSSPPSPYFTLSLPFSCPIVISLRGGSWSSCRVPGFHLEFWDPFWEVLQLAGAWQSEQQQVALRHCEWTELQNGNTQTRKYMHSVCRTTNFHLLSVLIKNSCALVAKLPKDMQWNQCCEEV